MSKLEEGLNKLANEYETPDFAIIVNGSDPYKGDVLPSSANFKLEKDALLNRDLLVYNFLKDKNIPQSYLMAGGYGDAIFEVYGQFIENVLALNLE